MFISQYNDHIIPRKKNTN